MSDDADAKARPERLDVGSFAPHVPFLTARNAADRGPAGSLVQARARERALRIADRRPLARDWRAWTAAILLPVACALLAVGWSRWAAGGLSGPLLLLLAAAATLTAAAALAFRYRIGPIEA